MKTPPKPHQTEDFEKCKDIRGWAHFWEMGCVDRDTEYLSPKGWKKISTYTGGEVAQWDPGSRNVTFVVPCAYIDEACDEMVALKTCRGVDQLLSPEHRTPVRLSHRREDLEILSAHQILERQKTVQIPSTYRFSPSGNGIGLSEEELRLQIACMADGYFPNKYGTKCILRLKKSRKISRLKSLLGEMEYSVRQEAATGFTIFTVHAPLRLKSFPPHWWEDMNEADRDIIYDEVFHWDGHFSPRGYKQFFSRHEADAEFIQFVVSSLGHVANIHYDKREGGCWSVHQRARNTGWYHVRSECVDVCPSPDGRKYCFTVPSGHLLLRRNKQIFPTGNCGKSYMGIAQAEYLYEKGDINALLVIAPPNVHDIWVTEQLPAHCDKIPWTGHIYHASKAGTKKHQQECNRMMKEVFPVLVMSYPAFRTPKGKTLVKKFLKERKCLFILDECFRKGTLVDTPNGPVCIEDISPGDIVLGANGNSTVREVGQKYIERGIRVKIEGQNIDVSHNHPFFTNKGWVPACKLVAGDLCVTQSEAVRMVQGTSCEQEMPILRDVLLSEMEDASAGNQGQSIHRRKEQESILCANWQGYAMDAKTKNPSISGSQRKTFYTKKGKTVSVSTRGKRKRPYRVPETFTEYAGRRMDTGVCSLDRASSASTAPYMLQDRYSSPCEQDSSRAGWDKSQDSKSKSAGQKEERISSFKRVESVQNLELGHDGISGEVFYDLEVSGHPSYSVNGILVHNCQRIKTPGAKVTRTALAASAYTPHKRILSGTSVTNSPFDVYSQIKFLDPEFWPRHGFGSYQSFKTTFGVFEEVKFQKRTEGGMVREQAFQKLKYYRNLDHLCNILKEISDRHLTEEVLDLPERTFSRRYFDPSPEQKRMYKEFATDFYAFVEASGEMVTTQLAITRLVRFQQLLSGFLERDIEEGGGRIFLEDNPRLNCLLDVLENDVRPGKKVIIWARFRQDIDFIIDKLGEKAVRFDGQVAVDDRYQNRKRFSLDPSCLYFVANPAAGGTGLTLNEAQTVIYYTNSHDLEQRLQSEARNYRIGQAGTVNVIDIVARGLPFDSQLLSRLRAKAKMAAKVMGDDLKEWI